MIHIRTALWEILSPSPELRDHIATFKHLAQLYAAVRNACAEKVGFVADLAYKTKRLVEENATQSDLGTLTKSVTFDLKTLEALRGEKGSDEGKVLNLIRRHGRGQFRPVGYARIPARRQPFIAYYPIDN